MGIYTRTSGIALPSWVILDSEMALVDIPGAMLVPIGAGWNARIAASPPPPPV